MRRSGPGPLFALIKIRTEGRWFVLGSDAQGLLRTSSRLQEDFQPLPASALVVSEKFGRSRISCGALEFRTWRHLDWFEALAETTAVTGAWRRLEVCRAALVQGGKEARPFVDAQVRVLLGEADPRIRHTALLAAREFTLLDAARERALAREVLSDLIGAAGTSSGAELESDGPLPGAFLDFTTPWRRWQLSEATARWWIKTILEAGEAAEKPVQSAAQTLSRAAYEHAVARAAAESAAAYAQLRFAEQSIELKHEEAARSALASLWASLPPTTSTAILDPEFHSNPLKELHQIRIRAQELLRDTAPSNSERLKASSELARLEPLSAERLAALASVATGAARSRAENVLALLAPGGLAEAAPDPSGPVALHPLSDELIEEFLVHPLARKSSRGLSVLKTLLAGTNQPEFDELTRWCEPLREVDPKAELILRRAADAFGLSEVQAYVSRGRKKVGIRAYEGERPFVLIGGQHLADQKEHLNEAELRFAVSSELLHLKLGHARFTSQHVWEAALEQSRLGLELSMYVLPILRGWAALDRMGKMGRLVRSPKLTRGLQAASSLQSRLKLWTSSRSPKAEDQEISLANEQLIFAHRLMQFSADRAGLWQCGELKSAIRAMFLVRSDYAEILASAIAPLPQLLAGMKSTSGLDLRSRIIALIAFYLSDDFDSLARHAC
jgi:hypothetical protein